MLSPSTTKLSEQTLKDCISVRRIYVLILALMQKLAKRMTNNQFIAIDVKTKERTIEIAVFTQITFL